MRKVTGPSRLRLPRVTLLIVLSATAPTCTPGLSIGPRMAGECFCVETMSLGVSWKPRPEANVVTAPASRPRDLGGVHGIKRRLEKRPGEATKAAPPNVRPRFTFACRANSSLVYALHHR